MRKFIQCAVLLCSLCMMSVVFAAVETTSPLPMLKQTSDRLLADLKSNHDKIQTDMNVVFSLVDKILIPHVDLAGMSRSVLGRNQWNKATHAQQQQFMEQFTHLVTRTYASALQAYSDEKIRFLPLRGDPTTQNRVQIDSVIVQRGGPTIPVSYRCIKKGKVWKVYDLIVDNVSLLQSFRSQFASELADNNIDHLLSVLKKHNTQGSE